MLWGASRKAPHVVSYHGNLLPQTVSGIWQAIGNDINPRWHGGKSLESAIEKRYIQWKHLKPWQPKEGPQRHCQQRCPSYEAMHIHRSAMVGGWPGHGDWAAHALQVQSITGSTQDRASDLWSRGFLPFWHPWPSGTMYLRAHVSENDKEQSNSFASQGLWVTRQEGSGSWKERFWLVEGSSWC